MFSVNNLFNKKNGEYENCLNTPIKDSWLSEINDFIETYKQWLDEQASQLEENKSSKKREKKKKT